ncbi:MAG: hypothetical protein CMM61_00465 [Rhodospirillaceae bacterium]|nr:hypothetical protein [Rhodospirillaceae bacterium]
MVEHKLQCERLRADPCLMCPELAGLYEYWSGLATPPDLPPWGGAAGTGFRLVDLSTPVLPILAVVDVGPDDMDYVYRYWGTARDLFQGKRPDPTGRRLLDGLKKVSARNILAQYKEVYQSGRPTLVHNIWPLDNGLSAECETLRLPLGSGGPKVEKIVAATRFIRHADEFRRLREQVD